MKILSLIASISIIFSPGMILGAQPAKKITWADTINELLESEKKEGFYDNPGIGYPWAKVEVKNTRGVLICPEAGMGKAYLILKSGDVYEREATSQGQFLSFCPTIISMDRNAWNKFEMDEHWSPRKRDGLAQDFDDAVNKAEKRFEKNPQ